MRRLFWIAAIAASLSPGCDDKPANTPTGPPPGVSLGGGALGARKLAGPDPLPAQIIAELAEPDADVRFVRNGARGLLLARRHGRWLAGAVAVGRQGAKVAADDAAEGLKDIAPAPAETTPSALVALGDGFALAWVEPVQGGQILWGVALAPDGTPRGEVRKLSRSLELIEWVELVEGGDRAFAVWDVKQGETSQLIVSTLNEKGASAPAVIARQVAGWHAAARPEGAVVAWVAPGAQGRGRVHSAFIDPRGAAKQAIAVSDGETALVDVQVAALGSGFAVAWTDTGGDDPHVHVARLGPDGTRVASPRAALDPIGGQALVSLVASSDRSRALIAWERDSGARSGMRSIELGVIGKDGKAAPESAELWIDGGSAPHIVADGRGFAALTLAPMRVEGAQQSSTPTVPTYVRFGPQLAVRAAEPVRVAELASTGGVVAGIPASVSALECDGGVCTVVARGQGSPALVLLVGLPARPSAWEQPARRLPPPGPPLPRGLDTLATADEPIAKVSAARLPGGRTLVAWVTHAQQSASDKRAPARATLAFRFLGADGKAGPVQVLTERAISIGGVKALAVPPGSDAVALLAWAGPQNRDAQIYLTALDDEGKTLRQKTVTKIARHDKGGIPNEVYDVDVTSDGKGGFVCAWADSRDGDLEIYAARVDAELQKKKGDRRVTSAPGPSTEASVRVVGDRVLVLFSHAGDSEPRAEIYLAALDRSSLEIAQAPKRLEATPQHSRTPRWAEGALAASWIEERTDEAPGELRLMAMNEAGEPTSAARRVRFASGAVVTSAAIGCQPARCRGILGGSEGAALSLGGFSAPRESGAPIVVRALATTAGGTAQDPSLTAAADSVDAVFFVQDMQGALAANPSAARIRGLSLAW